jgi:hypothetical protein
MTEAGSVFHISMIKGCESTQGLTCFRNIFWRDRLAEVKVITQLKAVGGSFRRCHLDRIKLLSPKLE